MVIPMDITLDLPTEIPMEIPTEIPVVTSGLTLIFQTEKLLHHGNHEVKTELRWDVHETEDTSSQLPSTAEDALMQLAVMAKDSSFSYH